jgi:hypothetical protein
MNIEPLRQVQISRTNNVTTVEGKMISGEVGAARAAFAAGAAEMSRRYEEAFLSGDMRQVMDLIAATKTYSFFREVK